MGAEVEEISGRLPQKEAITASFGLSDGRIQSAKAQTNCLLLDVDLQEFIDAGNVAHVLHLKSFCPTNQ